MASFCMLRLGVSRLSSSPVSLGCLNKIGFIDGNGRKEKQPLFTMMLGGITVSDTTYVAGTSVEDRERLLAIRHEIVECERKVQEIESKISDEDLLEINLIEEIDEETDYDDGSVDSSDIGAEFSSDEEIETENDEFQLLGKVSAKQQQTIRLPEIPTNIIGSIVAPMISDRSTFDSLAATCKDIRESCMSMDPPPPWPEALLRTTVGLWSIAFSPEGDFLAAGGRDGRIRLFSRRHGVLPPLEGHAARVYSIVFHPEGRMMVTGSGDGDVFIWDLLDLSEPPTRLHTNTPHIDCLAFNHDGTVLASSGDGTIRLWNMETHECLADITEDNRVIESVAFSPDGKTIAAGSWAHKVSLWDLETRHRYAILPESTCVHSICYSPDGKYICSSSDSRHLRLWNVESRTYSTLEGHTDSVWSVAFSPNGQRIASGSDDGTLRVFDTSSGKCTTILNGHDPDCTVYGVAFSPCNDFVASASDDGFIQLRRYS